MMPKQYAEQLYNKYYAIIFEYGEEMSQEIVISKLAKKCAIESIELIITTFAARFYLDYELNFFKQTIKELEQL